jgi:hypothetical protein
MDLGARQIRTAGKGSGSIEVTLPADLRDLVGLSCRISLHDGPRPQIVLQPDLQRAQSVFATLWRCMVAALRRDLEAGAATTGGALPAAALRLGEFDLGLRPHAGGGGRPFLCWRDGLALCRPPPHDAAAMARTLAAFGHALTPSLGIAVSLAADFGAVCGHLATGIPPAGAWQEACDLAAAALRHAPPAGAPMRAAEAAGEAAGGALFWQAAEPLLSAAVDLFRGWTVDPASHAALRAASRRSRCIELNGG